MKKIVIAFRNRMNMEAIDSICDVVQGIFQNHAVIDKCFVNEFTDETRISADVFVVINKSLIFKLRTHAVNFKNVVVMSRSTEKDHLKKILEIPDNSDVLIVNDTVENGEEMCYMFYELGICHLNFIAFDKSKEVEGAYDYIKYAITPNEPQLVPEHIKKVINTGYRKIGFDTMIQIANILDLNRGEVNYKLIEYASTVIEPMQMFQMSYLNSFLKSQMLNEYVYDSTAAIFVCDYSGNVIYSNKHAKEIFEFVDNFNVKVDGYLPEDISAEIRKNGSISKRMVSIDNINYVMDKVEIIVAGRCMGYFVTLQDEIAIKDIESTFHKSLRDKGLLARYTFDDIVHSSKKMKDCIHLAKTAALSEYTLLIRGESGTGKELLAQSIHNYSTRKNMPFVGVNCAAIPETLLESELFGYEEGAFTGAKKKGKLGYFEHANKGTIFLDEIGDISPKLQARLLRVLQEKQIMRIGSDKVIDVDVRIIAATNKNLMEEVKKGNFREDLYYRLNIIQIVVPPLRERTDDVELLFKEFMGKDYISLTMEEHQRLKEYNWPGNVRELENCALYYKTLKRLPEQFKPETTEMTKKYNTGSENRDIKTIVLKLLKNNSEFGHGIGRTAMMQLLMDRKIKVSDAFLRTLLAELERDKLIVIGKGRQGTVITEEGINQILDK